jgi:hypothetical protein
MRELQPALPRRLHPPLAHSSPSLLQSITQQLMQQQQQDGFGMLSQPDGSWTLPAAAQNSSSSSSSDHADSWIEPGADDTAISNLVFMLPKVRLSGTSAGQLQQLLQKPGKPAYQLLVPSEAVTAAEQAVAAAAAAAGVTAKDPPSDNGVAADNQQQKQQQHSSSSNGSSSSMRWRADSATEHLLSHLPDRWVVGTSARWPATHLLTALVFIKHASGCLVESQPQRQPS